MNSRWAPEPARSQNPHLAAITVEQAQNLVNNPAGYYFNVHTQLNRGGAIRAQLVRVQ